MNTRRPRPRPGGRYRILVLEGLDNQWLVGKIITIDNYHGCAGLSAPYTSVTGRIAGALDSWYLPSVALERVESTGCACPRLPHIHKRTPKCQDAQ